MALDILLIKLLAQASVPVDLMITLKKHEIEHLEKKGENNKIRQKTAAWSTLMAQVQRAQKYGKCYQNAEFSLSLDKICQNTIFLS